MLRHPGGSSSGSCAVTSVLMALFEEFSIFNSNGLEHLPDPSTILYSRIIVEAKEAAEYHTAMKQFCSRRLADFNPESAVEEVVRSAVRVLHLPKRRISKSKCDVILSPQSAGAFIAYLVAPMIVGKSVQAGASCFTNMLKKKVAAESFSLADQGRIKGGIGSAIVDDEGNPTKSTTIIENGTLKGFLYDTLTACWSEESSTGNARRASDTLGRTYLMAPEPLPTNLVTERGDYGSEELIEETKEAILVNSIDYAFPLVPERGYFNMTSSLPMLLIEHGEIEGYTENVTVSDELSKALTRVNGIGKDLQQSTNIGSTVTFSPYLRIKDMTVS
jgi:predicted Zn-dependent protease